MSLTHVECRRLASDGFFAASSIGAINAFAKATSHSSNIFALQTSRWVTSVYSTTLAANLSATSGLPGHLSCCCSLTDGYPKAYLHTVLYFYDQNDGHASHRFSADTAISFLLIYGDLGDLLEKSIWEISSGLVVKVQYLPAQGETSATTDGDEKGRR